jgi:hypothetical protein
MPKLIDGWARGKGECPLCFTDVESYATLRPSGSWLLEERCFCRHINDVAKWPFVERDSVTAMDFHRIGFEVTIEESISLDDDAYLDEVDHGWENSKHW